VTCRTYTSTTSRVGVRFVVFSPTSPVCRCSSLSCRQRAQSSLMDASACDRKQPAVNVAGEWYGDPATSSLKLEPQIAFMKPATDVVLLGHAYPSKPGGSEGQVGIRVGPVQKVARVWGDRMLVGRVGPRITPAAAFEKIPLVYERSFGGWDRRHAEVDRHRCEGQESRRGGIPRPSVRCRRRGTTPNFEDPNRPFSGYGDAPPPAGFGFIQASWQPRVSYAGTYDEAWEKTRKPLLPADFDRPFFQQRTTGLDRARISRRAMSRS
jgi:hypothetical protein